MLEISLPLLEAPASSEIENIVTSADTMFRHLRAQEAADPATREALRYRTALLEGFAGLKASPLGAETAKRVCSRIKRTPMHVRRDPGTVIAGRTGIVSTPPVGETRIRELLATVYRGSANLQNRRFHTYCATAIPMSPPNKPPEAIPQYR